MDGHVSVCLRVCVSRWVGGCVLVVCLQMDCQIHTNKSEHTHTHTLAFNFTKTPPCTRPTTILTQLFFLAGVDLSSTSLEKRQRGFCMVSWCRLLLGPWVGSAAS